MTIEELERGMKIPWDEHAHSAERLNRIEALQEKAELEMAELRASQKRAGLRMAEHRAWQADFRASLADLQASERTMLDGLKRLAHVVTNIGEAQARADASIAAQSEDLQGLAKRMDAFIAALRNGREQRQ